jgi:cysteine desulfurase / selenocysteine lyase
VGTPKGSTPVAYLDHGATSWPKPKPVVDAVVRALTELGGNPGRSAYAMALESSRAIFEARGACARLLGVAESRDLIFQSGCTAGCNLMLKGLLKPGDRVVVGSMEHNSVARPLARLERTGVEVVVVKADPTGLVDPDDVERAVRAAPTRAVVCLHASNLTGTVQLIGDLADVAHEHGALMLVDGAQGAGHLEVDIALSAWTRTRHPVTRGCSGPKGVGLLYLAPASMSRRRSRAAPAAGAPNRPTCPPRGPTATKRGPRTRPASSAWVPPPRFLAEEGTGQRRREAELARRLHEGILEIEGFRVLGPPPAVPRVPIVSAVHDRVDADRIAFALDRTYGIATRAGLHCAPWAHETVGTLGCGAVRFGLGWGNTGEHVELTLRALREIAAS